jgi:hyaluronan synthase
MIAGIIQLLELIMNYRLHPFLVFFALSWGIFAYRIYYSRKNKRYDNPPVRATTSAIVLTYHDKPEYLKRCLDSLRNQTVPFTEVILAMDPREGVENRLIAEGYADRYGFKVVYDKGGNKRTAFAGAFKESRGEIVYMLAGDTIYPPNTVEETLRPFADPKVGATTLKQRIYERDRTLARRFADIMYNIRFLITYPSLSSKSIVICTTGEIGAFRREVIERHLDDFLTETFLGRRCILGDDRYLTSMVLKDGYGVVMQPIKEDVLTDSPDTMRGFVKQQLRWYRSGQRYSIKTLFLNWIPNKPAMLKIHCFSLLVMPYFFIGVIAWAALNSALHLYPVLIMEGFKGLYAVLLPVTGFYIAMSVKSAVHLKHHTEDWAVFPIYALFAVAVILPTFAYALLTIRNQEGWLTR